MATATSNRPGTRAKVRMVRMSASKARVVLNLIRGKRVEEALEILEFTERLAADPIAKCLKSAIANAVHNEDLSADELFISACFADEGPTLKRFRPRARGRAGRIHKQTCHITVEVARFTDDELDEARKRNELKNEGRQKRSSAKGSGAAGGDRAARVAKSRAAAADEAPADEADDTVVEDTDTGAEDAGTDAAEEATETEAKTDATADEAAEAAEAGADESDATDEAASAGDEEE